MLTLNTSMHIAFGFAEQRYIAWVHILDSDPRLHFLIPAYYQEFATILLY